MTDDLVKRLREVKDWWREPGRTAEQAADRIEELERLNAISGKVNLDLMLTVWEYKKQNDTLIAAIQYSLDHTDGWAWLERWNEGDSDAMRQLQIEMDGEND